MADDISDWDFVDDGLLPGVRSLYEEAPAPQGPSWRIEGTWLVEVVNECTCGVAGLGYGHERGCGMEPIVDLSKIPGWEQLQEQIRRG